MTQLWEEGPLSDPDSERRQKQKRKNSLLALSAATLIILGFAIPHWFSGSGPQVPVRVKALQGQIVAEVPEIGLQTLQVGDELIAGTSITVSKGSLLALEYDGHDIRFNQNSQIRLQGRRLELLNGELYFSGELRRDPEEDEAEAEARRIVVDTGAVRIRHMGTQFTVLREGERVIASVRQGSIQFDIDHTEILLEAGDGYGQQAEFFEGEAVRWNTIDTHGRHWAWIHAMGRDFDIEGNTLHEFLSWSTRESGLQLSFSSDAAEIYAHSTILHGSIAKLGPDEAVETVLATTRLQARRGEAGVLRVVMAER
jgi:hypothetical protein